MFSRWLSGWKTDRKVLEGVGPTTTAAKNGWVGILCCVIMEIMEIIMLITSSTPNSVLAPKYYRIVEGWKWVRKWQLHVAVIFTGFVPRWWNWEELSHLGCEPHLVFFLIGLNNLLITREWLFHFKFTVSFLYPCRVFLVRWQSPCLGDALNVNWFLTKQRKWICTSLPTDPSNNVPVHSTELHPW